MNPKGDHVLAILDIAQRTSVLATEMKVTKIGVEYVWNEKTGKICGLNQTFFYPPDFANG